MKTDSLSVLKAILQHYICISHLPVNDIIILKMSEMNWYILQITFLIEYISFPFNWLQ